MVVARRVPRVLNAVTRRWPALPPVPSSTSPVGLRGWSSFCRVSVVSWRSAPRLWLVFSVCGLLFCSLLGSPLLPGPLLYLWVLMADLFTCRAATRQVEQSTSPLLGPWVSCMGTPRRWTQRMTLTLALRRPCATTRPPRTSSTKGIVIRFVVGQMILAVAAPRRLPK